MAIPVLGVEEFQYTDNGLVLNSDAIVPFVDITKIDGLDSAPTRISTHDREGTDGGYVDAEFEQFRTVILDGTLYTNNAGYESYLDSLKSNFAPGKVAQPLYFGTDAGVRAVFGKAVGIRYSKEQLRRLGATDIQIQVLCQDSRIYTPDMVEEEIDLSDSALTGRGYDKSFDYGYGGINTSNTLTVALGGNRKQPGTIRIYGPINNPILTNDTIGTTMIFSINIASGDYLEIDLNAKTVMLNGTINRRNIMTLDGAWYLLQPGNNTFRVTGSGTVSGTSKLYVGARQAAWR